MIPELAHSLDHLIDGDLVLRLKAVGRASSPDQSLEMISFQMLHAQSHAEMGGLNLRVGYTTNVILYRGNIGFTVFAPFRGHRYALRSCRLLVPFLKTLPLSPVWLTCNPDNAPSRKTIERLGARYIETLTMPNDYAFQELYPPESRVKMRYRWDAL